MLLGAALVLMNMYRCARDIPVDVLNTIISFDNHLPFTFRQVNKGFRAHHQAIRDISNACGIVGFHPFALKLDCSADIIQPCTKLLYQHSHLFSSFVITCTNSRIYTPIIELLLTAIGPKASIYLVVDFPGLTKMDIMFAAGRDRIKSLKVNFQAFETSLIESLVRIPLSINTLHITRDWGIGPIEQFYRFIELLPQSNINHLELNRISVNETFMNLLPNTKLISLRLVNSIDQITLDSLSAVLPMTVIKHLAINGINEANYLQSSAGKISAASSNLETLDLNGCDFTMIQLDASTGAKEFFANLGSDISSLDLGGNFLGESGIKHLSANLHRLNLRVLKLSRCGIRDHLATLTNAIVGTNILDLQLQENVLGHGMGEAVSILKASKVVNLDLARNEISAKQVKMIANNLSNCNLRGLSLAYNKFGNSGLREIALKLPSSNWTELNLSNAGLQTLKGHDEFETLAANIKTSKLNSLNLAENALGDVGAMLILNQLDGSSIVELNLKGMKLSSATRKFIAEYRGSHTERTIKFR